MTFCTGMCTMTYFPMNYLPSYPFTNCNQNLFHSFTNIRGKSAQHLESHHSATPTQASSNKNMATAFVTDCSKSSEPTLTITDMLLSLPPTEVAVPPGRQESEKDQNHRRKKAYKWNKHFSKPARACMKSIVDYYANDIDITRQDVDLLPWNLEETKVIKETMKSTKRRRRTRERRRTRTRKRRRLIKKRRSATVEKTQPLPHRMVKTKARRF